MLEEIPTATARGSVPRHRSIIKSACADGELREVMYPQAFRAVLPGDRRYPLQNGELGRATYYRGKEKLKKELEADGYEA